MAATFNHLMLWTGAACLAAGMFASTLPAGSVRAEDAAKPAANPAAKSASSDGGKTVAQPVGATMPANPDGAKQPAKTGSPKPDSHKPDSHKPAPAKPPADADALPPAGQPIPAVVDSLIERALTDAGIKPAGPAEDATLVRRITLDLVGRIPTAAEARAYVESTDPDKRVKLVDRLMASPAYARRAAADCETFLGGDNGSMSAPTKGGKSVGFRDYLTRAFAENRPWDRIFREVITAAPDDAESSGAAGWLLARLKDQDRLATEAAVAFFGVNVSCAQCHDHPLVEEWKQDHFYGMKSFFSRTFENGGYVAERGYGVVGYATSKGVKRDARLMFLTGAAIEEPASSEPDKAAQAAEKKLLEELKKDKKPVPAPAFSRRAKLVEVALAPGSSDYFARAAVNRVWLRLFGFGIVMPADQMHSGNPPSHPELLAWLARDFAAGGYDLRKLERGLILSNTYARSSRWEGPGDRPARSTFAVGDLRPLNPRQYGTSLRLAGTSPESLPATMKPADLEKALDGVESAGRGLASAFEQPNEDFQISADEALFLSNSERVVRDVLDEQRGRLIAHLVAQPDDAAAITAAYWNILSRPPAPDEVTMLSAWLVERGGSGEGAKPARRLQLLRHVAWSLMAGSEFRFNH